MTPATIPARVERQGALLMLTLDNPKTRNAFSPEAYDLFADALAAAATDEGVRAVVITGANGHFSSGGNVNALEERRQGLPEDQRARIEKLHRLVRILRAMPQPVVAAVEGAAAGAGMSLALAADLLVAGEGAIFSMAYVRIGLTPDGGGTSFLGRAVPHQLAAELVMLGDRIAAPRLAAAGLINRLVPDGQALPVALELAGRLAEGPRGAITSAKRLLTAARTAPLEAQLDAEAESFVAQLFGPEAGEGLSAFREKRPPRFG